MHSTSEIGCLRLVEVVGIAAFFWGGAGCLPDRRWRAVLLGVDVLTDLELVDPAAQPLPARGRPC